MTQLGRYEDLEEVGRGGFATVYKAHDPQLNRAVALKILHAGYGNDVQFIQRFQQEAQTIAKFNHPNIVTIYEVGEIDRQFFIAMEFLSGNDLYAWLQEKGEPLTVTEALTFLKPIANALDYAHGYGIVHRDVKPNNVMLQPTGNDLRVVLTDFGLVKAMENSVALSTGSQTLGSPEYMAPEQADIQRSAEIGPATDLYAFGIVAYQMLVGRVPFPGNTLSVLVAHMMTPPPSPQELNENLSSDIADIVLKMLSKAPADRYPTATAFVEALQAVTQSREQEEKVAPLYEQLQVAKDDGNWIGMIQLGAQIATLYPNYKDVAELQAEAIQQLQKPPEPPKIEHKQEEKPHPESKKTTSSEQPIENQCQATTTSGKQCRNKALEESDFCGVHAPKSEPEITPVVKKEEPPARKTQKETQPTVRDTFIHEKTGLEFVRIPAGEFLYGEDKKKIHLPEFWIGKTPVTNAAYKRFIDANPEYRLPKTLLGGSSNWDKKKRTYPDGRAEHPVVLVSWDDTVAFCKWAGLRLPTEEEWEKAARGTDGREYPWGNKEPTAKLCNFTDTGIGTTSPIGQFSPQGDSPYGCVDMAGNVREWCYVEKGYLRGGSWLDDANRVRSADRVGAGPSDRYDFMGFRCASLGK